MPDLYHYTDPRGRRSGPFTEQELKNLAARGLLEAEGRIELSGLGVPWSVAEVDWLRDAFPLGSAGPEGGTTADAGLATEAPPATVVPLPPAPPDAAARVGTGTVEADGTVPPPSPIAALATGDGEPAHPPSGTGATARTPELPFAFRPPAGDPRAASASDSTTSPTTSPTTSATPDAPLARSTYVLLAVLPALVGVFGVHNVLAGFTGRGIAQLVLSVFTLGGLAGGFAFPPTCCCFGAPMYLVLLVWVVVEAIAQTVDARGRTMP